jgi:preprotein translocase subunit SecE
LTLNGTHTGVAQLVEHWSPKPGVGRSSSSSRANLTGMRRIRIYFEEVYKELIYKVTWPSWKELQSSAIIVMIATLIIGLIIFTMDFSFQKILNLLYKSFF